MGSFIVAIGLLYGISELSQPAATDTPTAEHLPQTVEKPTPQKPREEDWEPKVEVPPLEKEHRGKPVSGIRSWLEGDAEYDNALTIQKKLKQPILIDFSPSWCKPCQLLARNFFSRTDVMTRIDRGYIPLRTGDGPLSRQFRIKRYPTIAVVNLDGTFRTFQPTESNFFDELEAATK